MTTYVDSEHPHPLSEPRIFIRVAPEPFPRPVLAMVDTAAPWCIFTPAVAWAIARYLEPVSAPVVLSTRFGRFSGVLHRGMLTLLADEGEPLEVDATIFLSPEWTGPNFIGYQGLLQRIRFAVDPEANLFYFGRI
ncbi:MAG: hypothetical protein ACJ75H_04180 [Thermoanaerobaculia bacterium]